MFYGKLMVQFSETPENLYSVMRLRSSSHNGDSNWTTKVGDQIRIDQIRIGHGNVETSRSTWVESCESNGSSSSRCFISIFSLNALTWWASEAFWDAETSETLNTNPAIPTFLLIWSAGFRLEKWNFVIASQCGRLTPDSYFSLSIHWFSGAMRYLDSI